MKKHLSIFGLLSLVFVVAIELVLDLPSSSECGTAGIDFMPCDYWGRVHWSLNQGSWITLLLLWATLNVIFFLVIRQKQN